MRQRPEAGKILGVLANHLVWLELEDHLGETWLIMQGLSHMPRIWDSCKGDWEPEGV